MILGITILYVMLGAYVMASIMHTVAVKSEKSYSELFSAKKVLLFGLIWPIVLIRAIVKAAYKTTLVMLVDALEMVGQAGVRYEVFLEYIDARDYEKGEYKITRHRT